jgi:hypothetical protein
MVDCFFGRGVAGIDGFVYLTTEAAVALLVQFSQSSQWLNILQGVP